MTAFARLHRPLWSSLLLVLVVAAGCSNDESAPEDAETLARAQGRALVLKVPQTASWALPGLSKAAHVVRTEGGVAHIYASNATDLARVHGFVAARDRFFVMDLLRRLGRGKVAGLFGSFGLATDVRSRAIGMPAVAERLLGQTSPELLAVFDAYAEGINAYIAEVAAERLPPPSEVALAAGLLGFASPAEMMAPFDRHDLAGLFTVVLFEQGFEEGDIKRSALRAKIEVAFTGKKDAELRRKGAMGDLFGRVTPLFNNTTTPGYGLNGDKAKAPPPPPPPTGPNNVRRSRNPHTWRVPAGSLERVQRRLGELAHLFGTDARGGFGSNIWAVGGQHTSDGAAILASDGHLTLAVPSLMWRIGLDTRLFGGGDLHQLGLTFAGIPLLAAGTNGDVAWSTTYLYGDITDWYREELQLDAAGHPTASRFKGKWQPLVSRDETYDVAKVTLLGSAGGAQTWAAWTTFDGRRLVEIEGRPATPEEQADPAGKLAKGEHLVNVLGEIVVAGDVDGDGKVTGISMDLTTLDVGDTGGVVDALGKAADVGTIRKLARGLVGWGQNTMAADRHGSILYTSYNGTPCRKQLPRTKDGDFADGADPRQLLDGTTWGAFTIPLKDGLVDESAGASDPASCTVPFDSWPQAMDPKQGWLVNANNDFSGVSLDGSLGDDEWYLGGTWVLGYRAQAIEAALKSALKAGPVNGDTMATIQGTISSTHAELMLPVLFDALKVGAAAAKADAASRTAAQTRMAGIWAAAGSRFEAVRARLETWQKRGLKAESGVATFYHSPTAEQRSDAVATMLFNAWAVELEHRIFDDEGVPWPALDVLRVLPALFAGRGPDNPSKLISWNPATGESVFFDALGTDAVETSDEVALLAMQDALDRLGAPPSSPGLGGFGSDKMDNWLWGLRHWLRLDPLLDSFVAEGGATLKALTKGFAITPKRIPLAADLTKGDPRADLPGFPRSGDYGAVDAAAPNAMRSATFPDNGVRHYDYAHGPNMRMVMSLGGKAGFAGRNILPGGQSAIAESAFFDDQVQLWLGNTTWPMRLSAEAVVAGASSRELFEPATTTP